MSGSLRPASRGSRPAAITARSDIPVVHGSPRVLGRVVAGSLVGVDAETGGVYVLERPRVDGRGVITENGAFGYQYILRILSRSAGESQLRLPGPILQDVHHYTPPCLARSEGAPLPGNHADFAGCFGGSAIQDAVTFFPVVRAVADPVFAGRALGLAATPRGDAVALLRVRREAPGAGLIVTQIRGGEAPQVRTIRTGDRDTALGAYAPLALSPSGNHVALLSLRNEIWLVGLRDGEVRRVPVPGEGLWEHLLWGHEDLLFAGLNRVYAGQFCMWQIDVSQAQASVAWCEPSDPARDVPTLTPLGVGTGLFWSGRGAQAWTFGLEPSAAEPARPVDRHALTLPLGSSIIAVDPIGGWVVCEGDEVPEQPGTVTLVGPTTFRLDTGSGTRLHSALVRHHGDTLNLTFFRYLDNEQQLMSLDVEVP